MTFVEAVEEESKVFFCQCLVASALRLASKLPKIKKGVCRYLVQETAQTQAQKSPLSDRSFVASDSWHH